VYALEHNFRWVYPIVGTAEVANATYLGTFTCKARDSLVQSVEVKLDGAKDLGERERLDFEVVTPAEAGEMMAKCLTIERDPGMQEFLAVVLRACFFKTVCVCVCVCVLTLVIHVECFQTILVEETCVV